MSPVVAEQYAFLPDPDIGQTIDSPAKVLALWTSELDAVRATGSLCVITCRPFLSGRPSRLRIIADLIVAARDHGDVELTRCDVIAARVLDPGRSRRGSSARGARRSSRADGR